MQDNADFRETTAYYSFLKRMFNDFCLRGKYGTYTANQRGDEEGGTSAYIRFILPTAGGDGQNSSNQNYFIQLFIKPRSFVMCKLTCMY